MCNRDDHTDRPCLISDEMVESLDALVRYHETGGHEGDGSDEACAKARAVLTALQNRAEGWL